MSDEELDQFHTELRQVMTYIKYSRDKEALKEHMYKDDLFKEVDRDTAELLKVLLNAKFEIEEGKEKVNMCLAEEQWGEEERNKGRIEGRAEGRAIMKALINGYQRRGVSYEETYNDIIQETELTEEVKALIEEYWIGET